MGAKPTGGGASKPVWFGHYTQPPEAPVKGFEFVDAEFVVRMWPTAGFRFGHGRVSAGTASENFGSSQSSSPSGTELLARVRRLLSWVRELALLVRL